VTSEGYARQLLQLLPPGRLWTLLADTEIFRAALGLADELSRVDARGVDLLNEADPRNATETIEDWERALGLPDERVLVIPSTIEERRIAVAQKLTNLGGQSVSFFVALAAACGYTVTVSRFRVLRVGCRVGDRVYGDAFAYSFEMLVETPTGDALPQADFERVIEHATHAHATVVFTYV
jgi:uncharacterized protein YmfQ (DUF2313 family)